MQSNVKKSYANAPRGLCEVCQKNPADSFHHKFHRVKWAVKLYGSLIDDPLNLQYVCRFCHSSHASPELTHWSENEYCEALKIAPRSKYASLISIDRLRTKR